MAEISWKQHLKQLKSAQIKEQQAKQIETLCQDLQLKAPVAEYRFYSERLWRMDYAWPQAKVAIEIEGGIYQGGDHTTSMQGVLGDIEKYNTAASMGWLVLRATTLVKPAMLMKKFHKKTGAPLPRKVLPWMSMDDPAFRKLLSAALILRYVPGLAHRLEAGDEL